MLSIISYDLVTFDVHEWHLFQWKYTISISVCFSQAECLLRAGIKSELFHFQCEGHSMICSFTHIKEGFIEHRLHAKSCALHKVVSGEENIARILVLMELSV
jgi:hypothetical protein